MPEHRPFGFVGEAGAGGDHRAGDDGQRIFVLNMLPELVDKIVSTVNNVSIDRVAVVDGGSTVPSR